MTDWNALPCVLTLEETARVLRCGYRRALELCRTKGFPAIRVGRKWVISRDGLREWIQRQYQEQSPAARPGRSG